MKHFLVLLCWLALSSFALAEDEAPKTKTLVWPDGTRYVGGVVDGKRSGKGTIFWNDGTRFVGNFENDMRNGPGTMILPDGTVYTGYFKDDELVEPPVPADTADEEAGEAPLETPADIASTPEEPPAAAPAEPSPVAPPVVQPVTRMTDEIEARLKESVGLWAAAWAEQNVVQYLDWYSDDFEVPTAYGNRSNWASVRRSRLTRPDKITIDLDYRAFELVEPDVVDVTFRQTYSSDRYSDVTIKTLRLRKEGPGWKILSEQTE